MDKKLKCVKNASGIGYYIMLKKQYRKQVEEILGNMGILHSFNIGAKLNNETGIYIATIIENESVIKKINEELNNLELQD